MPRARRSGARPAAGGRAGRPAPGGRGAHRVQHGGQPRGAHGHQRAHRAGQVARGQPTHPQQPAGPDDGGQGQLHPHHRLCRGAGPPRCPRPQRRLRGGRRGPRQARRGAPQARRAGPGRGPREERREPDPAGAVHQRGRHTRLPLLRAGLRGPRPQDPLRPHRSRRLFGHHRLADQPRHARNRPIGAPAHARPGRHHRRGRTRLPGRVRGRRPSRPGGTRSGQGGDPDLDLRPPHHPGCGVGAVLVAAWPSC